MYENFKTYQLISQDLLNVATLRRACHILREFRAFQMCNGMFKNFIQRPTNVPTHKLAYLNISKLSNEQHKLYAGMLPWYVNAMHV